MPRMASLLRDALGSANLNFQVGYSHYRPLLELLSETLEVWTRGMLRMEYEQMTSTTVNLRRVAEPNTLLAVPNPTPLPHTWLSMMRVRSCIPPFRTCEASHCRPLCLVVRKRRWYIVYLPRHLGTCHCSALHCSPHRTLRYDARRARGHTHQQPRRGAPISSARLPLGPSGRTVSSRRI